MNNFDLIEQIHLRLPLWDKVHSEKTDTSMREELWDEVAHVMGCSKEILKSRWKNLRDSYRKIIRKSDGRESDPKWPYYNAMEFMREITINARPKVMDITRKVPSIEPDYSLTLVRDNEDSIDHISDGIKQEKSLKRHAADDLVTQFLEIESEKSQAEHEKAAAAAVARHLYDDDDYQFLVSLQPHLKQVALNRKLPLRMKIEQLVYDEIYAHGAATNCSY
ncbi:PREDICTED: uncharacterized protein LOC108559696 [Nicrophorus vespilloides]|uniref:Uncharacterized protein LOC108559696 n=1 Tax=Nicrophorus vespilloides TaxID=110193 RepID=A0ABM1MD83_NICVS|nr:PREDICTED: uncharacterized protein LOC108559696 [Nicrophorus vespilloides]